MSEVEQLEQRVSNFPPKDLVQFPAWLLESDARMWDQQIEADLNAGKLGSLITEAVPNSSKAPPGLCETLRLVTVLDRISHSSPRRSHSGR